ncbi:DeoR family transcriptional regulator, partial [Providencia rettgeri]|nr:DeoR family transcriptional regulator [Providencia rettgeri]
MSTMDRLDLILEYLKQHNLVTVDELVQALSVSAATIRRDLIKLDE